MAQHRRLWQKHSFGRFHRLKRQQGRPQPLVLVVVLVVSLLLSVVVQHTAVCECFVIEAARRKASATAKTKTATKTVLGLSPTLETHHQPETGVQTIDEKKQPQKPGSRETSVDALDDNSIEIGSSAMLVPSSATSPSLWKGLVPTVWDDERGWDRTVEWDCSSENEVRQAAQRLIPPSSRQQDDDSNDSIQEQRIEQLVKWMGIFGRVTGATRCKARIVASRGKRASVKCPQWHIDHVPVRWIQSLAGPGCQYVDFVKDDNTNNNDVIDWSRINNLYNDDNDDDNDNVQQFDMLPVEERNRLLVPDQNRDCIRQVPEGQAIMLIGNGWSDWVTNRSTNNHKRGGTSSPPSPLLRYKDLPPIVHKSPDNHLDMPWQGRVLLTMDIVG